MQEGAAAYSNPAAAVMKTISKVPIEKGPWRGDEGMVYGGFSLIGLTDPFLHFGECRLHINTDKSQQIAFDP